MPSRPRAAEGPAAERDRFLDLLRVGGVLAVVAGHWLSLIPSVHAGTAGGVPIYQAQPQFWPLTWVFGVLPLFFFVGGYANLVSHSRAEAGGAGRGFLGKRLRRLLGPTLVFVGAWALVEAAMQVFGLGAPGLPRGFRLGHITPFETLWFVAVYLLVVLLVPITLRLHRAWGWAVPAALLAAVAITDLAAWRAGLPALLFANVAFAWLLPHQLGYLYADGRLQALPAGVVAAIVAAALALTVLLTGLPFYSRDLLDGTTAFLGVAAPTLPFVLLDIWIVGGALLARRLLTAWLRSDRVWAAVSRLNSVVMTLFLWHMTAYFAVLVLLARLGVPLPAGADGTWWLERPLFLLLPALALVPLVWLFGRFETGGRPGQAGTTTSAARRRTTPQTQSQTPPSPRSATW